MTTRLRISIVLLMGCVLVLMGAMFAQPSISTAQIFVTNTPRPPDPLEINPNLPAERYALRLWTAPQFLEVFISLLGRGENSVEFYDAVRLIQYELAWRFPNAPEDSITRQRLFNAMITAPRGSVDMRGVARLLVVEALRTGQLSDFHIDDVATLNIDGDAFPDALYHLRYPADDAQPALYSDYIITRGDTFSSLVPMPADVFAAPYRDILGIDLLATGDYTGDGLDEILISLDYAGANDRLVVYGWRNTVMTDLAVAPIEFGDVTSLSSKLLQVVRYEVESEKWGCYRSRAVNWAWASNFFRDVASASPTYLQLNTIGCQMVAAEPIYEKLPADALTAVNTLLLGHASDETGYAQAILATAMLEWLNGQKTNASLRVISLSNTPNLPLGIRNQIAIFQDAIAQNESAVVACANLTVNNGICDIDQLISRILAENPISRTGDVQTQLEEIGLPVESIVTVSQVGRADRLVATFALAGASQWAFAPLDEATYVVEKLSSIITRDNDNPQLAGGDVPATAWTALIINNDGISALNILDNAIRQNSALATSLEIRYFRAFAFDRIGDRPNAISGYYELWRDFPDSLWGKLAGAHLEPR